MKLSQTAIILAILAESQAYLTPQRSSAQTFSFLRSSATSNDAAFSAFAESLEVVPESPKEKKTWQSKLDDLLNPTTKPADRQILLSELLSSNEQIRESVMDAMASRRIDPLLTPTAARLQDGTKAVVRQIANDILPELSKTAGGGPTMPSLPFAPPSQASMEKAATRFFDLVANQLQNTAKELQEDLADPINKIPQRLTKQRDELVQEAKNVFLETPEGLAEPVYSVVETCDLYEIRDYEAYSVASTTMPKGEDMVVAGNAFNTLASYLFGDNQESKAMAMTTPVTTTSLGEMRFYLADPKIPLPLNDGQVDIMEIPPARLAVRKFTGFATDGEVARQKDTLLQALEMDGVELDVAHGAVVPHVVFQYNPPYTIPIVRRNEVAVPVRAPVPETAAASLKEEWSVEVDDAEDDISPSDVDM